MTPSANSHGATTTLAITVTGGVDPGGSDAGSGTDPGGGGKTDGPADMATGEVVGDMAGAATLGGAFPKGCSFAGDGAGTLQVLLPNQGGPCPWPQGAPVAAHLPPAALRVLASA